MLGKILRCGESAEGFGASTIGQGRAWYWWMMEGRTRNWTDEVNRDSFLILSGARAEGRDVERKVIAASISSYSDGLNVSHRSGLAEQCSCFRATIGQFEGGPHGSNVLRS